LLLLLFLIITSENYIKHKTQSSLLFNLISQMSWAEDNTINPFAVRLFCF
jgi:hypothetical protein